MKTIFMKNKRFVFSLMILVLLLSLQSVYSPQQSEQMPEQSEQMPEQSEQVPVSQNIEMQSPAETLADSQEEIAEIPIKPAEVAQQNQTGAIIAFTFDDGYLSDYEIAYPILKKYGIRGTSYIIPEYQDSGRKFALTWEQVKEMAQYGWVFGCHTYAHTDLKKMTPEEIAKSMEAVDAAFEKQGLEKPVIHAFPFGSYNQQAIDAMKPYRVQMRKAFYEEKFVDLNSLNPYEIDSCSADMRSEKRLKEHEALVDKACEKNAILVFRCHCLYRSEVNDMGEWPVQTDSKLFEQLVTYCVQKGCRFITMTELKKMYADTKS